MQSRLKLPHTGLGTMFNCQEIEINVFPEQTPTKKQKKIVHVSVIRSVNRQTKQEKKKQNLSVARDVTCLPDPKRVQRMAYCDDDDDATNAKR